MTRIIQTGFVVLIAQTLIFGNAVFAKEFHVSVAGSDNNSGSESAPFRTIGKATSAAFPGDVITVHAGTYREWINPPRGGTDHEKHIVYRAAPDEHVEIKGSEQVAGWGRERDGVWKVVLPDSFFAGHNPYKELIHGDWFNDLGRPHHTGEVFLNGKSLFEVESKEKVFDPGPHGAEDSEYTWYCESDRDHTTIWANFHRFDPNMELVEISVRKTCFYPESPGVNYITVRGFHFSQAATQWAAPTAEQIGMIATHWNKGWIIEDNVIGNSKCVGITLGKDRKTGHNTWSDDRSIDGALHYIEVIFNTIRNGWNRENIGSHIVRNNTISDCGQAGICGSMGGAFSEICDNHIYRIWTKRQFDGAEIAAVKLHGAVDTKIERNRIHDAGRGIWLDWMTQGTRVSKNLLYGNDIDDIFVEVNHGPFLIDHNICGSRVNIRDWSQGGAYFHNLFAGKMERNQVSGRYTPYFLPHTTDMAGFSVIAGGDDRFLNNLFVPAKPDGEGQYGTAMYNGAKYPMMLDGNVYYNQASACSDEKNKLIITDFNPGFTIQDKGDEVYVGYRVKDLNGLQTGIVSTDMLGKAKMPRQKYEDPDGKPIASNQDYHGRSRNIHPVPGPFETSGNGNIDLKVWLVRAGKNRTEKKVVFKQVDTVGLKLHVLYPDNFRAGDCRPAIIFFFGGGWKKGNIGQFRPQAEHYCDKGLIAILAEYRVESRNNTTPFEALADAKSAIRYLRANALELGISSDRIIASGGSAGGHLAAATACVNGFDDINDDLSVDCTPNALVLFNPVLDNSPEGCGYDRIEACFPAFSPLHNIRPGLPPTIIFLGTDDHLIPVSTMQRYRDEMHMHGDRCELYIYEGQKHGFFNKWEGNPYYGLTLAEADTFLHALGYLE